VIVLIKLLGDDFQDQKLF